MISRTIKAVNACVLLGGVILLFLATNGLVIVSNGDPASFLLSSCRIVKECASFPFLSLLYVATLVLVAFSSNG